MNVKSREFAPFTFKRDLKNNKLAEGLGGFLWWLLAPVLWPKRSRRKGTKKKLKKIRQIIRLLEAYPDKPQWELIATFGPTPRNQNDNYRPHSMIDALRIATTEETRLLDEGKKKTFLSPFCTFSAPRNIELTRSLYVADLIGAAIFSDESQFAFWEAAVRDGRLPLTARAIIKRIREFRQTRPHCLGIVQLKLFNFKYHSVFATDRKSFVAWVEHGEQKARRQIQRQLHWTNTERQIVRLLLKADQYRAKQSCARKEAEERRRSASEIHIENQSPTG